VKVLVKLAMVPEDSVARSSIERMSVDEKMMGVGIRTQSLIGDACRP
jgi:hypothetical protein